MSELAHTEFAVDAPLAADKDASSLRSAVLDSLARYFDDLDGHAPREVYRMVVGEVEQAMLESVMDYARGNQTHAAEILGINRGTLRKKLRIYSID